MTDEQASDWEYKIICCLGISTSNSDINVVGLHKTVTELYEQGCADEREAQVCCGDYEKCMKACTPRGRWLAEKELAKPESHIVKWSIPVDPNNFGEALAQPEQEHKPWVGLTDEDAANICMQGDLNNWRDEQVIDAVEAKLKELNT